jgi:hypothetical protein
MSMSWRRMGTASNTPRKEMARIQTASSQAANVLPVAMKSAGMAEVRPAPVK